MINFQDIAVKLLHNSQSYCHEWLPGGKMIGHEYTCGSISGGPGDSFRVNCDSGAWAEFAGDLKGGDLISLYAAIHGIKQGEAAKKLATLVGLENGAPNKGLRPKIKIIPAPDGAIIPRMEHMRNGKPSAYWCYRDKNGLPIFYVARYDTKEGKQFCPFSWGEDGRWHQKGYPEPRPLYNLNLIHAYPDRAILIVEGEKAAEAAMPVVDPVYVVTTWPNGSKSAAKADWNPVYGRKVLIWPDADGPGMACANEIATELKKNGCEVKVIDTTGLSDGFDAADANLSDWAAFKEFAVPRIKEFTAKAIKKMEVDRKEDATDQAPVLVAEPVAPPANVSVEIKIEDDTPADSAVVAMQDLIGLAVSNSGKAYCNADNALRVFERHPDFKGKVWFDEFRKRIFTTLFSKNPSEYTDVENLKATTFIQRNVGLTAITDNIVHHAAMLCAHIHSRNELKEWMESLVWDGKQRIDSFFTDGFSVIPTPYSNCVSKNFWIGMIARVFRPGCQLDNMVVLQGAQGVGKTSALRILGGDYYAEAHDSVGAKDFFMSIRGKMIVEIAELDSFSRADLTQIKRVITCTTDRYRSPYGRTSEDTPRSNIFVATTNEDHFLKDTTGARRFWPLKCGQVDRGYIKENREQLFAEAVACFKQGQAWHDDPPGADEEQEMRRSIDEWEGLIQAYLDGHSDESFGIPVNEITLSDIWVKCLKGDIVRLGRSEQIRLAAIVKKIGFEKNVVSMGGRAVRVWARTKPS